MEPGGTLNVSMGQQQGPQLCGDIWENQCTLVVAIHQHIKSDRETAYVLHFNLLIFSNNFK